MRVAKQKGVSLTNDSAHGVASVPVAAGFFENSRQIQMVGLVLAALYFIEAQFVLCDVVQTAVFFVEKVPNFFHHRDGVGLLFGVLPQANELLKELIDVGHVEVPCDQEVAAHVVRLAQKGVAGLDAVASVGSVPKVSNKYVAGKGQVLLHPSCVFEALGLARDPLFNSALNAGKNVLNGLGVDRPRPADVALARRHVKFYSSESAAVLTAVVLLLHHQHHLVKPIQGRPVLVEVVV